MASFLRTGPFFSGSLQYQVCGTATIQSSLARKTLKWQGIYALRATYGPCCKYCRWLASSSKLLFCNVFITGGGAQGYNLVPINSLEALLFRWSYLNQSQFSTTTYYYTQYDEEVGRNSKKLLVVWLCVPDYFSSTRTMIQRMNIMLFGAMITSAFKGTCALSLNCWAIICKFHSWSYHGQVWVKHAISW
jgi:hypothetical protein